jgi:predicted metal-dependent hydrolase
VDDQDRPIGSARELFETGVVLFNRGEFFEAHEAMEEAMELADDSDDWEFYLGLLRAAVANHKLTQGEISSAIIHLQAALRYLAPYSDRHQAVKLRELRYALSVQLVHLSRTGKDGCASLPSAPHIEFA